MFVQHEVVAPGPVNEVERRLVARLVEVEGLGSVAYRHGEDLRSRVGPVNSLDKEVVVAIDRPVMTRAGLVLPVTWRATGAQALFPRLRGDLAVSRRDDGSALLQLKASYRPPFGWIGDVVDRLLLARFARLTVEDWLDRIAQALSNAPPHQSAHSTEGERRLDDSAHTDHRSDRQFATQAPGTSLEVVETHAASHPFDVETDALVGD